MTDLRKIIGAGIIGCLALVAIWVAFRPPESEAPPPNTSQLAEPSHNTPARPNRKHQPRQNTAHFDRPVYVPPRISQPSDNDEAFAVEDPDDSLVPPAELLDFLSDGGLPYNAEVRSAKRDVADHTVSQVRVRFTDDDGTVTEIEMTDMGAEPPAKLLTALGFNPKQKDEATDTGFRLTMDSNGRLGNWEYDQEAMTGMFQVVVAERFMVEVRLEGVEAEAFNKFFHDGIPIAELEAAAGITP